MTMDFLRPIQHALLPMRVDDPEEVGCVRLLPAAQLVDATVKESHVAGEDERAEREDHPLGRADLAQRERLEDDRPGSDRPVSAAEVTGLPGQVGQLALLDEVARQAPFQ